MRTRKLLGVWLDRSKAVIVNVSGSKPEPMTLYSKIESQERVSGQGDNPGRFGKQFLDNARNKENRHMDQERRYLAEVVKAVSSGDQLLIFGPAETKNRLAKMIRDNPAPMPHLREVATADSMTDNQIAAYVREYYGK